MARSAYDISIRETLQKNRKAGTVLAIILLLVAGGIAAHYFRPSSIKKNDPSRAFFSDDDGQTYFEDSVFKFPPFDHNGKTAVRVAIATSGGHIFVAYLQRYTPDAQNKVQEVYDNAVRKNLPVQQTVLNCMTSLPINLDGTEVKLPGSGHEWIPRTQLMTLNVKSPTGETPEGYIQP